MTAANDISKRQAITAQMQTTIDRWEADADARILFLSCYQLMTANVLTAIAAGEFHDASWVNNLLHRFAAYYFNALEAYDSQAANAPAVWRIAFDSAGSGRYQPLQLLIMGVNAHINYDLVLTLVDMLSLEWQALSAEQKKLRYADHCHINDVIGRTIDIVQDQIIEPNSPGMNIIDTAFGPLDEWLTSRVIRHWREEVWQNATSWLAASNASEQEALRRQVEATTLTRADAIMLNHGLLMLRHLF